MCVWGGGGTCVSVCLKGLDSPARSSQQLPVPDSRAVGGVERTAAAAAAGEPRGDQQEAAGEKPRKAASRPFRPAPGRIASALCSHPFPPPQSVWVRKGALRWWRDWKPQRWVDVAVALEQSTKSDGRKDSIFFVYYTQYDEKKVGWLRLNSLSLVSSRLFTHSLLLFCRSTFMCLYTKSQRWCRCSWTATMPLLSTPRRGPNRGGPWFWQHKPKRT